MPYSFPSNIPSSLDTGSYRMLVLEGLNYIAGSPKMRIPSVLDTATYRLLALEGLNNVANSVASGGSGTNPFPKNSSSAITRDGNHNPISIAYSLAGVPQGFADITYDGNTPANPLTLKYYKPDHTTQIGNTITFVYDGAAPPNLIGVTNG